MEKATVGMAVRRSGARLRAMAKAHGPLHVVLWQAREAQSTLLAAASAQKSLFNDVAAWASTENRALSDVCSCLAELGGLYTATLAQLALAYKVFRKELGLVLEGERRCDAMQRKLHEAENKRIKLRRQVLRAQNRVQTGEARRTGDFTALQTQLAEAERAAERAHMQACSTAKEQEAVKLVVVKSAVTKLTESHLELATQTKPIFEGGKDLAAQIPEPPPPGDPVSCVRYAGYDYTKGVVERIKSQTNINLSTSAVNRSRLSSGSNRPVSTSTPISSPNISSVWGRGASTSGMSEYEPPPPYNISNVSPPRRLSTSHCLDQSSRFSVSSEEHRGPLLIGHSSRSYSNIDGIGSCNNLSVSSVSSNGGLARHLMTNLSLCDPSCTTDQVSTSTPSVLTSPPLHCNIEDSSFARSNNL